MKKIVCLVLCTVMAALVLCACSNPGPGPGPGGPAYDVEIFKDGACANGYIIVYEDGNNSAKKIATELSNAIRSAVGVRLSITSDASAVSQYEILVGKTNRAISSTLMKDVNNKPAEDFDWGYYMDGKTLALYADSDLAWERCIEHFSTTLIQNKTLVLKSNHRQLAALTAEEYQAELDKIAAEEEEKRQQAMQAEIDKLLPLISSEFSISDFYGTTKRYSWSTVKKEVELNGFYAIDYNVTSLMDMTNAQQQAKYATPAMAPTVGQHPRLLFTKEDIPSIKEALNNPEMANTLALIKAYVEDDEDGKLPPITYIDPNETKKTGARYNSNFSAGRLAVIQAKAFWYAITGDKLYGYQAIYAIKNYLKTMDIGFYDSDQCRYFGYTAYMAALVYDWCYDLLSDEDKEQIALGIQTRCFQGYSSIPDGDPGHSGLKSEVGFPPTIGTGPVEGHGSELAILRDFLSVAIAIYDEAPSWYNLIGGRVFQEYVPVRNFYYEAGMYPEGTATYAPFRYMGDLYSAWMLESSLGENPYIDGMQDVVISMLAHDGGDGSMFSTGDGNFESIYSYLISDCAAISSYLYDDSYARAFVAADNLFEQGGSTGVCNVTATELMLCAMKGTETAENWRDGVELITYNDGYYQQIIVRNGWGEDAATVLLRGAARLTQGHSHHAAGEFQIYYKGMLAGDDGVYDGYGTNHHAYYHKSTIAHSCVLIFNPDLKNTCAGYYSGGQKRYDDARTFASFMTDTYKTGEVLGVKYGYKDDGTPQYVYYANDLSHAYRENKVNYIGRSVVVTYPDSATYPMVMFVMDRMDVPATDYTKTFVVQCIAQPTIDAANKTATVDNGHGKMVVKNIIGGDTINAYGDEAGGGAQRYWISTQNKNLASFGGLSSGADATGNGGKTDGAMWGKLEIRAPQGNKSDTMVNVVYVTDSETTSTLAVTPLQGSGFVGAVAAKQVAVFATETGTDERSSALSFQTLGAGSHDYYVGGLKAGKWNVTVGTENLGTMTVADGENCLVFSAKAGKVTLTPAS